MSKKKLGGYRTIRMVEKAIASSGEGLEDFCKNAAGYAYFGNDDTQQTVDETIKWLLLRRRRSRKRVYRRTLPLYIIQRAVSLTPRPRRTYQRTKNEDRAHRPSRAMVRY